MSPQVKSECQQHVAKFRVKSSTCTSSNPARRMKCFSDSLDLFTISRKEHIKILLMGEALKKKLGRLLVESSFYHI